MVVAIAVSPRSLAAVECHRRALDADRGEVIGARMFLTCGPRRLAFGFIPVWIALIDHTTALRGRPRRWLAFPIGAYALVSLGSGLIADRKFQRATSRGRSVRRGGYDQLLRLSVEAAAGGRIWVARVSERAGRGRLGHAA